jgi:hydrogenase-4 component J
VPAKSKQPLHYTLAIGHHIRIIDCFSPKLEMSIEGIEIGCRRNWLSQLPKGEARQKLEGLLHYGEIEISVAHTELLREALDAGAGAMSATEMGLDCSREPDAPSDRRTADDLSDGKAQSLNEPVFVF